MCFVSSAPTVITVPHVAISVPQTIGFKAAHPRSPIAYPGLYYGYSLNVPTAKSSASFKPSTSLSSSRSAVSLKSVAASVCTGPWCVMYGSVCICVPALKT